MGFSKAEVNAVKKLGEDIGMGRVMQIASALWAIHLEDGYGLVNDPCAFAPIPPSPLFTTKKVAKEALAERAAVIQAIRPLL
jgi:hypothetical protein